MKTKITMLVIIGILISSCRAQTATQVREIVSEPPVTKAPATQVPVTPELAATEEPIAAALPTEVSTDPLLPCMTLLEPTNGIDLPVTGKVKFSWTSIDEARSYVLNFIVPSGATVSFETDQTFRNRYMEAFVSGGEYQWQVIAQSSEGSEICISEVSIFDKPAYLSPKQPKGGGNGGDDGNGNSSGGE